MEMHRIDKTNVTTIIYALMTRAGISVKFKVKLYTRDKNQDEQYYHQEFLLQGNKICINLSPRPYIEVAFSDPNQVGAKTMIYITEIFKSRIVRKLAKIANTFEAYDDQEVDILVTDTNGSRLHSEVAKPITVTVGVQSLTFTPVFTESLGKVQMMIEAEGSVAYMSVRDFICLHQRLKELNFTMMTMALLNYVNSTTIGLNRIDFRQNKVNQEIDRPETFHEKSFSKIAVMGSLIDIENPEGLIPLNKQGTNRPRW